jgi:hypothetical protein
MSHSLVWDSAFLKQEMIFPNAKFLPRHTVKGIIVRSKVLPDVDCSQPCIDS